MAASVTVTAESQSGDAYDITLTTLDATSASISLVDETAGVDESYVVSNVQRQGDCGVTCETRVMFATADIAVEVLSTSVKIEVSHIWFAPPPQTFIISPADSAALVAWMQNFAAV